MVDRNLVCDRFAERYLAETRKKVLLDVRNPEETSLGTLSGALLIPLPDLETRMGELTRDAVVYIHCKAGGRAAKAAELLARHGFTDVVCAVEGGFEHLKGRLG